MTFKIIQENHNGIIDCTSDEREERVDDGGPVAND
jgi:hypothetical protein